MVVGSWHFSQVQYERIKAKVKRKYIKNIRPAKQRQQMLLWKGELFYEPLL